MEKISGVYRITNTITNDFYIGSSKNIKQRWAHHKAPSSWNEKPNSQLYKDMQKYGTENFVFEIIAEVEPGSLKEAEQKFIETLKPTYNICNAKGLNIERRKEYQKDYQKSDKYKESQKEYNKTEKGKKSRKKAVNKYYSQLCFYNGETLTLRALSIRFLRKGISNPTQEAKKYLIKN